MTNILFALMPRRRQTVGPGTSSLISFNHDGVEIARVRGRKRRWLPVWHLMMFIYLILLIRLIAVADIGAASYGSRLEQMRDGSMLERVAAQIMGLDPLSQKLAGTLRSVLKPING